MAVGLAEVEQARVRVLESRKAATLGARCGHWEIWLAAWPGALNEPVLQEVPG